MLWRICLKILAMVLLVASAVWADERPGGMVLAFDDGFSSWLGLIAPELARVGGVATGFVNNKRIHDGRLSFKDLETLQGKYGWEIGTHTYNHFNAVEYVQHNTMSEWIKKEFEASIDELQSHGMKIHSMSFPFDSFTPELTAEIIKRVESFRYEDPYPIAKGKKQDGSVVSTNIDIAHYIPLELMFDWIDYAKSQNQFVFLFGHDVLPDAEFIEGIVTFVDKYSLGYKDKIEISTYKKLCLVPDKNKRLFRNIPITIASIENNTIHIPQNNLVQLTKPGATFIIGPCYSMQLSFFQKLIEYAAKKVPFYTIHDAITHKSVPLPKQQQMTQPQETQYPERQ